MILKIFGLGLRGYVADKFNLFDGIIVLVSFVEILDIFPAGSSLTALRGFRLMRILKLVRRWTLTLTLALALTHSKSPLNPTPAHSRTPLTLTLTLTLIHSKSRLNLTPAHSRTPLTLTRTLTLTQVRRWKSIQRVVTVIAASLPAIGAFICVLFIVIFAFAIFGMEFFGDNMFEPLACHINGEVLALDIPMDEQGRYTILADTAQAAAQCRAMGGTWMAVFSRTNFRNVYWACLTVFQIISSENWHEVLQLGVRNTSNLVRPPPIPYPNPYPT